MGYSSGTQDIYECLNATWKYGYEKEYFWVSGVTLLVIGIIGLIGNLLSLLVLCRAEFRGVVFYNIMIELICFDTIYILSNSVISAYDSMVCQVKYDMSVQALLQPISYIGLLGSIYSTIAVSVERYFCICSPYNNMNNRKTWVYIVFVMAIAITYNIPRFIEHQFSIVNGTLVEEWSPWVTETYQKRYWAWADQITFSLIPLGLLLLFNGAIIKRIYVSRQQLNIVTAKNQAHRASTTKILLLLVSVFLICHIPDVAYWMLYHGYNLYNREENENYERRWHWISPIDSLALIVNSSVNIVVYCAMGTKFRDVFIKMIRCDK